jgi:unsaturated chondroitin disaccharide hydrolase
VGDARRGQVARHGADSTRSLARALERIDRLASRFPCGFPSGHGHANRYDRVENVEWTPGFWVGLLWLAYQQTGEQVYRRRAEALIPTFSARLDAGGAGTDTHDLGFLYTLSCVAAWRLTGSAPARHLTVRAADALAARYWPAARIVQAWRSLDDPDERGRFIIDSAMNMPLLLFAAKETGRREYRDIAVNHLDQCVRLLVRPNGSTAHTCYVDVETGKPLRVRTHQGLADESCWARGQAWGTYGFALAYRYTGEERFREAARALGKYFVAHLLPDGTCAWDLDLRADNSERDTSAIAIAASGLCELSNLLSADDPDRRLLQNAATAMDGALTDGYLSADPDEDGILRGGTCHRPLGRGVNECCIWGDYFYVEALARQRPAWSSFW